MRKTECWTVDHCALLVSNMHVKRIVAIAIAIACLSLTKALALPLSNLTIGGDMLVFPNWALPNYANDHIVTIALRTTNFSIPEDSFRYYSDTTGAIYVLNTIFDILVSSHVMRSFISSCQAVSHANVALSLSNTFNAVFTIRKKSIAQIHQWTFESLSLVIDAILEAGLELQPGFPGCKLRIIRVPYEESPVITTQYGAFDVTRWPADVAMS